jgi:hypothetical protein
MNLLTRFAGVSSNDIGTLLAEGEGFEPPDLSVNGFQDRRLKPLGHPSCRYDWYELAGAGGFEPPNAGSKFPCLTA